MHLARLLGWHYDWLAAAWGGWLWVTRAIWVRRWWWDGSQLHARVEMQLTLVREESAPPCRPLWRQIPKTSACLQGFLNYSVINSEDFGVLPKTLACLQGFLNYSVINSEDFGVLPKTSACLQGFLNYSVINSIIYQSMFFIKDIIFPVANHNIIIFPVANHKMSKTSACLKEINVQNIENFGVLPKTSACL